MDSLGVFNPMGIRYRPGVERLTGAMLCQPL